MPVNARNGRCEQLVAYCAGSGPTEAEIKTRCRALIPDYMIPRRILIVDTLPITANGKIDHRTLAADAAAVLAEPAVHDARPAPHTVT